MFNAPKESWVGALGKGTRAGPFESVKKTDGSEGPGMLK